MHFKGKISAVVKRNVLTSSPDVKIWSTQCPIFQFISDSNSWTCCVTYSNWKIPLAKPVFWACTLFCSTSPLTSNPLRLVLYPPWQSPQHLWYILIKYTWNKIGSFQYALLINGVVFKPFCQRRAPVQESKCSSSALKTGWRCPQQPWDYFQRINCSRNGSFYVTQGSWEPPQTLPDSWEIPSWIPFVN